MNKKMILLVLILIPHGISNLGDVVQFAAGIIAILEYFEKK